MIADGTALRSEALAELSKIIAPLKTFKRNGKRFTIAYREREGMYFLKTQKETAGEVEL